MANPVLIDRVYVVHGGELSPNKNPWIVDDVETIDDILFIPLEKKNRGFARFVTGSCAGLRDLNYLDKLRKMRNDTRMASLSAAEGPAMFGRVQSKYQKRKDSAKLRLQAPQPYVSLDLPSFVYEDKMVEGITLRVKNTDSFSRGVVVEFSPESLQYIRLATLYSGTYDEPKKRKAEVDAVPRVCRWNKVRKAFVATCDVGGQPKYKYFKPKTDDPLAFDDARASAQDWVARCGVDSDDDDGAGEAESDDRDDDAIDACANSAAAGA